MAIKLSTTALSASHVKVLVYGPAGIGKTRLCATAPKPIIISAEGGLLSLADKKIAVIEINNADDLKEAFLFVTTHPEGLKFETICLDSISDIGEVLLNDLKKTHSDNRQAYGEFSDKMGELIRAFRDIPDRHVYFTAKSKRFESSDGITQHVPSMPGQAMLTNIPYYFDLVMAMRLGTTEDNAPYRYLQTQPDYLWEAKDRSGKLNGTEEPNLTKIFNKITKKPSKPKTKKTTTKKTTDKGENNNG